MFQPKKGSSSYSLTYVINQYNKKIEEFFDYFKLIENLQEVYILKQILLDKHQRVLLDLIKKETLEFKNNDFIQKTGNKQIRYNNPKFQSRKLISAIDTVYGNESIEVERCAREPIIKLNSNFIKFFAKSNKKVRINKKNSLLKLKFLYQ